MILLQPFTKADFAPLLAWISTEHLLTNWAGSLFSFPLTEESLDWYIADTNDLATSDAFMYKAVEIATGKTIGHISLGAISRRNRSGRISRVLIGDPGAKGKGYCLPMVEQVLRIGFEDLGLHRISLGVYTINEAAIRCYVRAGFQSEGVQRDVLLQNGSYWSLQEMSILEDEWRARGS